MNIQSIKIEGLFDEKNYLIKFDKNSLVIVAENGSGKTTILRLIYFFLTKQWSKLSDQKFKTMTAEIDGKTYIFSPEEFQNSIVNKNLYEELALKHTTFSKFILDDFSKFDVNELQSNSYRIDDIEQKFDVPKNLLLSLIESVETSKFDDKIYDWSTNVIYLPTYRRIERDYYSLFGDMGSRVANQILSIIPELSEKISREKENELADYSETENDINNIFSNIISSRNNEKWIRKKSGADSLEMIEFGMSDVNFKISEFYNSGVGNFEVIEKFVAGINMYFDKRKTLYFNEQSGQLLIKDATEKREIPIENLSSGEKQLISILAHLYFDETTPLIIIDEPEMSLSIRWQERLLTDILTADCDGLIVATHSPFIVSDVVKPFTYGINEFEF